MRKTKKFENGLIVGRFQPFHKGHKSLVEIAAVLCDTVVIAVGSAQESGTSDNPLSYNQRKCMIEEACHDVKGNIIIIPLEDMYKPDNHTPGWGDYVLSNVRTELLKKEYENPEVDIVFYGNEPGRSNWWSDDLRNYITEVMVGRDKFACVAGRYIRDFILRNIDDFDEIKSFFKEYVIDYSDESLFTIIDAIRDSSPKMEGR